MNNGFLSSFFNFPLKNMKAVTELTLLVIKIVNKQGVVL